MLLLYKKIYKHTAVKRAGGRWWRKRNSNTATSKISLAQAKPKPLQVISPLGLIH